MATLPAAFVLDWGDRWKFGGTIWQGEAVVGGTQRLEWRWAPLRTLMNFAFSADWRMTGGATDLAGSAVLSRGRIVIEGASGQADAALLTALAPQLPFTCDARMQVDIVKLVLGGEDQRGIGEIRSEPGRCALRGDDALPIAVPALSAVMRPSGGATEGWIAPAGVRRKLVAGTLSQRGRLVIAVTPVGDAALPFARGLRLERQF